MTRGGRALQGIQVEPFDSPARVALEIAHAKVVWDEVVDANELEDAPQHRFGIRCELASEQHEQLLAGKRLKVSAEDAAVLSEDHVPGDLMYLTTRHLQRFRLQQFTDSLIERTPVPPLVDRHRMMRVGTEYWVT